jgi:hypothetical protein
VPRPRHGLLAAYLIVRGVLEFFTVNYSDPASYRDAWGGPAWPGVFAVHSGPAVVIVAAAVYLFRHRARKERSLGITTIGT